MAKILIKRGTRAQLDSAAGSSGLNAGEPYLVTDENRIVIGLSATTYVDVLMDSDFVANEHQSHTFSATNSNAGAITLGQPVYVDGSGTVDLADSDVEASARVIGLVSDASIAAAGAGNIQPYGPLYSANWTSVVGSTTLTAGSDYFLSGTAGQLTTTAPSTGFVTFVGHALSTTTLLLGIERPIEL